MGRSGTELRPKPRTDGHKCGEWIEQMIGTMGRAVGKEVKTDCSINAKIDGKTYCFGNEAAKTEFMKDPPARHGEGKYEQENVG